MLQTPETGLRAIPFPVTDPEKIPVQRYFDEDFYKWECEHLWTHVWQMACRLEQIPKVGDWVEYTITGKSVLVVRTKDGVKAYHNHCRHRGVPIAGGKGNEHGNCAKSGFICPFHGWRWNMDGECTWVYGRHLFNEDLLDQQELALRPVRVELWGGCAFINFDDDAPSYRESMGDVLDRLEARGMSNMRAEWWFATVLPANWKIAMEAFQEGYHVMKTHPQLQQAVPPLYNERYGSDTGGIGAPTNPNLSARGNVQLYLNNMELLSEGMAGLIHKKEVEIARGLMDMDLPDDPAEAVMVWHGALMSEITRQLRERGENVPDQIEVAQKYPLEALQFLFPNYFLLSAFTGMSSYRIRPLGPESCLFELWSLTHFAPGQEPEPPMEPTMLAYDSKDFPQIPQQDYSNIPIQQRGLHSTGFEFMRLSREREGLISNNHRIIDAYLKGVAVEKIVKATQTTGDNFDGKILDYGF